MPSFPWIKSQQFYTLSCFLSLSSISSHANDNVQFDDCVHVRRRLLASPSLPPVYTVLYIHNAYIYFICIYIYVHKNSRAFMKFVRVCICVCVCTLKLFLRFLPWKIVAELVWIFRIVRKFTSDNNSRKFSNLRWIWTFCYVNVAILKEIYIYIHICIHIYTRFFQKILINW